MLGVLAIALVGCVLVRIGCRRRTRRSAVAAVLAVPPVLSGGLGLSLPQPARTTAPAPPPVHPEEWCQPLAPIDLADAASGTDTDGPSGSTAAVTEPERPVGPRRR